MFLVAANAAWPKRIASQSHSSKIEPNHFVFACAPRIGSGALALPMSGMIPKQGNKRSNRNTQPVATGVAEATKGDAKPQGKEAAPPSQGPAVSPEAETSQDLTSPGGDLGFSRAFRCTSGRATICREWLHAQEGYVQETWPRQSGIGALCAGDAAERQRKR